MKSNPLFFDSTKFRGDTVVVDIELTGVELRMNESLFARVKRAEGEALVQMQPKGLRKWSAQARMEYQQKAQLEFFVSLGGETLDTSDVRHIVATYMIHQKWERLPVTQAEPIPLAAEALPLTPEEVSEPEVVIKMAVEASDDLDAPFDESLINGPTLIENSHGVFEPYQAPEAAVPALPPDRRLPMIVEINNPKALIAEEKPFTNENLVLEQGDLL